MKSFDLAEWLAVPVIDLCDDESNEGEKDAMAQVAENNGVTQTGDGRKSIDTIELTTPSWQAAKRQRVQSPATHVTRSSASAYAQYTTGDQSSKAPLFRPLASPQASSSATSGMAIFTQPDDDFLAHLHHHGYAILHGVLGSEQANELFLQKFWSAMTAIVPGLDPHKRQTWTFPKGFRGIVSTYGLPQADFAWDIRAHPRVYAAFAKIFGTQDLVASLDAVILEEGVAKTKLSPWLHKDQRPSYTGLSVQAVYTHFASGPHDAGTCVVPGSHKVTYDWEKRSSGDHIRAPADCGLSAVKPDVPADSLVFFNSRLVHASVCGQGVQRPRTHGDVPRPARLGLCVAYAPRSRRSESTRRRKEKAYLDGQCSSHWPCDKFSLKPQPKHYQLLKGAVSLPKPLRIESRLALL
eukprot:TRINITY_DN41201_c0_g1_i1.p1 TRINITY_DN41201_c0_g1~~TRINITY_DN41201_c0_g1_i1.p1  ORF type:complete len:409 (+),score=60.02 TRINITY_DN41201_c0_g1_i1:200-1426(+)